MKKSRFTEDQIIGFLKQAEVGMPIKELCRNGGFSDATLYKWRAKFGGMQVSEAQRLRGLSGAQDEFLLAATAQNLRRMAKWLMPVDEKSGLISA